MGLCCCTLCFPFGCIPALCDTTLSPHAVKIFAVGFCMYLYLTYSCSKLDERPWSILPWEGNKCNNEGDGEYGDLGILSGILLGIGFGGILVNLMKRCLNSTESSAIGHRHVSQAGALGQVAYERVLSMEKTDIEA